MIHRHVVSAAAIAIAICAAESMACPEMAFAEVEFAAKSAPFTPESDAEKTFAGSVCADFSDDQLKLSILRNGEEIYTEPYCSSYGHGSQATKLVRDVHRKTFLLKEYGEGRGTDATTDFLVVYAVEQPMQQVPAERIESRKPSKKIGKTGHYHPHKVPEIILTELARSEIYVPRWGMGDIRYKYKVSMPKTGGLEIEFTGSVADTGMPSDGICCLPRHIDKIIHVDTK